MVKISVIGFGNIGMHLADAFEKCPETELVHVFSRSNDPGRFAFSHKFVHHLDDLAPADLYLISVSDSAIAEISENLPFDGNLVAHTSGSLPIDILDDRNRKGVFYPLQTFSKAKPVDFSSVPICLEAQSERDYALLETVAKAVSGSVYRIDSTQRRALHVSAVFASNFTNHLYRISSDICREHGIPFRILQPLIAETADKIRTLSPEQAQTGPAIRGDRNTIDAHLALLSDGIQKDIYQLLTHSIQNERKKL